MKAGIKQFAALILAAWAMSAGAQVSDSTAISGLTSTTPTLDCAAGQVKVGSTCNMTVFYGAAAGAACAKPGWIALGVNASGDVFSCSSGTWKSMAGSGGSGSSNASCGSTPSGGWSDYMCEGTNMTRYICSSGVWIQQYNSPNAGPCSNG